MRKVSKKNCPTVTYHHANFSDTFLDGNNIKIDNYIVTLVTDDIIFKELTFS